MSSIGRPAKGRLLGALKLNDTHAVRTLPRRHLTRCLYWGAPRLVAALERAGQSVQRSVPESPPLGVGDIARANGGPIPQYSKSHQAGRDADLAFYQVDEDGRPAPAVDLARFGPDLRTSDGHHRFDVERNWALVRALLSDRSIQVKWLFVSHPLRRALLEEARRQNEPAPLVAQAEEVLHQPTDSRPHDDHFHLRIECTAQERAAGCR